MTLEERLSKNQLKVMSDKYLMGDKPEEWLRGVAHNIALAELLYDDRVDREKILEGVSHSYQDSMLLLHTGLNSYESRKNNFSRFIKNLDSLSKKDGIAKKIVSDH